MNKEEAKVLYQITAYDRDFIKEIPDKARYVGGTNYYYYDFKNHRYLSQFISDDFDIYDEIKNLQQQNQKYKEVIDKIRKEISEEHSIMGVEVVENWVLEDILKEVE